MTSRGLSESELEAELESLVKRLDPIAAAAYVSQRRREALREKSPTGAGAPHILARLVEATCAYHRTHYRETLDWSRYAKIHNLLGQNTADFDRYVLEIERDVHLFGQRLYRQQIGLQYTANAFELARLASIYLVPTSTPFATAFERVAGVTPEFHVAYSALLYSNLIEDDLPVYRLDRGTVATGGLIRLEDVARYMEYMAFTVAQVKEEYLARRERIHKQPLRALARSTFLDRGLLVNEERIAAAPLPDLIIASALRRPFDLFGDSPSRHLLSGRFESHVGSWLSDLARAVGGRLSRPDCDSEAADQRCDFMIHCPAFVLLVECKSTYETPTFLTHTALGGSNLAKALGEAMMQLAATAQSLTTVSVPIFGAIAMPFDLPFPNSEWHMTRTAGAHVDLELASQRFTERPQVLCAADLERLITYSVATGAGLPELFKQKAATHYSNTGDWNTYLSTVRNGAKIDVPKRARVHMRRVLQRARLLARG